jgi:hypothetical protein
VFFAFSINNSQWIALAATCGVCTYLMVHVGRAIFYAANPDKRPIKKKRRK